MWIFVKFCHTLDICLFIWDRRLHIYEEKRYMLTLYSLHNMYMYTVYIGHIISYY